MTKTFTFMLLLQVTATGFTSASAAFYPSGSDVIDQARRVLTTQPTDAGNFRDRSVLLFLWLGALQQQGADTSSFFDLDKEYYALEKQVIGAGAGKKRTEDRMCDMVNRGFAAMERIQQCLVDHGPMFKPFTAPPP